MNGYGTPGWPPEQGPGYGPPPAPPPQPAPPPYGPPPYGPPSYGPPRQQKPAIWAVIPTALNGVLIVVGGLFNILGLVFGIIAITKSTRGDGSARAFAWLSWITLVIGLAVSAAVLYYVFVFLPDHTP